MSDEIIDLLTACFWDLRSQCESQVRTLSAAQRLLDEYRLANREMSRKSVVRNLRENVKGLAAAGAAIEEVLAEVRRQIGALAQSNRREKKVRRTRQARPVPRARR
jgi:hypothetical protein